FVLRGLDAGCPIGTTQSDGPGAAIRTWLERHGCLAGPAPGGQVDAGTTLARLVERGAQVTEAVARGRRLAADHSWERTAARLAAALPGLTGAVPRPGKAAA
ncbi:MAG: hypothetical protein ACRENJ_05010, partial [Candidatus Eiseniibacteriota bacterium]